MSKAQKSPDEMSFLEHLEALRWHLVRAAIAIVFMGLIAFLQPAILFDVLIFGPKEPDFVTYRMFCEGSQALGIKEVFCFDEMPFQILNTKMAGQFSTHIWVSFLAGIIFAFPYLFWEIWRFIKPGLKESERAYSRGVIFFSSLLFAGGVLFGYFLIVPLSVQFLGSYQISAQITNLIDLSSFISTVTSVTLACGILFELPIIVYFLSKTGIITPEMMRTYRKHALVVILILAAVITPPDLSSQVLVAVPVLILYEISIRVSKVVNKKAKLNKQAQS
ncbi:MAG: twin-arginine translocase subunit TatC [Schleiferiaceae bacterium]|nr:twin-arginine translocase subunit TatC [Schleiferiaceae bacterium]